jgi:putative N6-adenine-specific DNA methylase
VALERTPLAKRINRQVSAREHDFFAITTPGVEKVCLGEFHANPELRGTTAKELGGISFRGKIHHAYWANLHIRTATRILMRIATFTARDFRKMAYRIAQIPWELYIHRDVALEVRVSVDHCRLYHTKAIAERFTTKISMRTSLHGMPSPGPPIDQTIYVRGKDDRFTISLDTSGEALYKRGMKTHGGKAPIRETLASAILLMSGYSGNEPLIDPMCGAGTFCLEAAMISGRIPAGWHRDFAFMGWPGFQPGRWRHLRKIARQGVIHRDAPAIFSSDQDLETCTHLRNRIENLNFMNLVTVRHKDFFTYTKADLPQTSGLVVINPPFGFRMLNQTKSKTLILNINNYLRLIFPGWKISLLSTDPNLNRTFGRHLKRHRLTHGGLTVWLFTGVA